MHKLFSILLLFFPLGASGQMQARHYTATLFPAYKGLVMAGYQGWFRKPENGIMYADETKVRLDMWPDVTEYEVTYPTGLKLANAEAARFFSSDDASTVDLHFKWMKQYGVDGVFMQHFFSATNPDARQRGSTQVLRNALRAASKYERAIGVMYEGVEMQRTESWMNWHVQDESVLKEYTCLSGRGGCTFECRCTRFGN